MVELSEAAVRAVDKARTLATAPTEDRNGAQRSINFGARRGKRLTVGRCTVHGWEVVELWNQISRKAEGRLQRVFNRESLNREL
jgi:hypothetical protein